MMWFGVGSVLGVMLCIIYIALLFVPSSRKWLVDNIFGDSVYGEVLEFIDDKRALGEDDSLVFGIFILIISTLGILTLIFFLSLSFSYVLLVLVVILLVSYIISKKIKK